MILFAAALTTALAFMLKPDNYSAQQSTVDGVAVVRLTNAAHHTEVAIAPGVGDTAYEMTVNGKRVLWSPYHSVAEFKAKPVHLGVPFLAPWANRLDQDGFWANGKHYGLNASLDNIRRDGNGHSIHGFLTFVPNWQVVKVHADNNSAEVTSRLEFWRHPDWMAQFPFAHTIEITHRLHDGVLEVITTVENLSAEPMPLAIGYHPYFQLNDAPRDDWQVTLPVREHVTLNGELIPTGATVPMDLPQPLSLKGRQLDDVFTGLERDAQGRTAFSVQGKSEKITVVYGPKYPVAVVYAPPGRNFICFEPMAGLTNAFNLNHDGKYPALQSIAPGTKWSESFWIQPSGF